MNNRSFSIINFYHLISEYIPGFTYRLYLFTARTGHIFYLFSKNISRMFDHNSISPTAILVRFNNIAENIYSF